MYYKQYMYNSFCKETKCKYIRIFISTKLLNFEKHKNKINTSKILKIFGKSYKTEIKVEEHLHWEVFGPVQLSSPSQTGRPLSGQGQPCLDTASSAGQPDYDTARPTGKQNTPFNGLIFFFSRYIVIWVFKTVGL